MSEVFAIAADGLSAKIDSLGAELLSLTDGEGREYMTDADPRSWTGHAPLLFPIVGRLKGNAYRLDGRTYSLAKHGFARKRAFACVEQDRQGGRARFALEADAETLASYPFRFELDVLFEIAGLTLSVTATVRNRDSRPMPFSFGFHPAFAWPLPDAGRKEVHRIVFARDEPEPIRRIDPASALLLPEPEPTPVTGRELAPRGRAVREGRADLGTAEQPLAHVRRRRRRAGDRLSRLPAPRHLAEAGRALLGDRAVARVQRSGRLRRRFPGQARRDRARTGS